MRQQKLERREYPGSIIPCTRYQLGYTVQRTMYRPDYEFSYGHRIKGFLPTNEKVPVFQLVGFGSTLDRAQRMAAKRGFNA